LFYGNINANTLPKHEYIEDPDWALAQKKSLLDDRNNPLGPEGIVVDKVSAQDMIP
jgi:hypothetical protein